MAKYFSVARKEGVGLLAILEKWNSDLFQTIEGNPAIKDSDDYLKLLNLSKKSAWLNLIVPLREIRRIELQSLEEGLTSSFVSAGVKNKIREIKSKNSEIEIMSISEQTKEIRSGGELLRKEKEKIIIVRLANGINSISANDERMPIVMVHLREINGTPRIVEIIHKGVGRVKAHIEEVQALVYKGASINSIVNSSKANDILLK